MADANGAKLSELSPKLLASIPPELRAELTADEVGALAAIESQDARYALHVDFLARLGMVKFQRVNKLVNVPPDDWYMSYDVLLRCAGQILSSLPVGQPTPGVALVK